MYKRLIVTFLILAGFIRGNWDVCFYLSLPDAAAKKVFLPIIPLRVNVWE